MNIHTLRMTPCVARRRLQKRGFGRFWVKGAVTRSDGGRGGKERWRKGGRGGGEEEEGGLLEEWTDTGSGGGGVWLGEDGERAESREGEEPADLAL